MSFLNSLTADQKKVIVSLPYRVGLCVSQSDTTGGEEANARELQALSNILHGYAEEVFGAEIIQYIISETLKQKDQWESWSENMDTLEEDIRLALDVMEVHADPKELNAFKNHLIEIGEAVALAFREYEHLDSLAAKLRIYGAYVMTTLNSVLKKQELRSLQEFLSISVSERKALNNIAQALGTTYM